MVPVGTEVHVILDNDAPHKPPKARAWLEKPPRWTFHFTPPSASWLNVADDFFAKRTTKCAAAASAESWTSSRHPPLHRRAHQNGQALPPDANPDHIIETVNIAKRRPTRAARGVYTRGVHAPLWSRVNFRI